LKQGISFLLGSNLATLSDAWEMASARPQKVIQPDYSIFQSGSAADVVQLKMEGNKVRVLATVKNGIEVFRSE
jgi:N-acetylglucosamine-6-phosphate deacetylase